MTDPSHGTEQPIQHFMWNSGANLACLAQILWLNFGSRNHKRIHQSLRQSILPMFLAACHRVEQIHCREPVCQRSCFDVVLACGLFRLLPKSGGTAWVAAGHRGLASAAVHRMWVCEGSRAMPRIKCLLALARVSSHPVRRQAVRGANRKGPPEAERLQR